MNDVRRMTNLASGVGVLYFRSAPEVPINGMPRTLCKSVTPWRSATGRVTREIPCVRDDASKI